MEDGKYHEYILQPSDAGYVLEEAGGVTTGDLKQYVYVVTALPESGQQEGILYIVRKAGDAAEEVVNGGFIWVNGAWKQVFVDVEIYEQAMSELDTRMDEYDEELAKKAPIENPVFSGTVKVGEEEVALKSYVDGLFANLTSTVPGIVDSENPIPENYKAGEHYRVAEAGTYAGHECEVGDLILVIADYVAETASDADFIVLQANIDGAVTSTSEVTTVGEIVVFDAVTGKVIKGSGVQIASLNDAIAKAHEHANKEILDSYDKTQAELLEAAKGEAQGLVSALEGSINTALEGKADKGTTLAEYGITDAYTQTEIDGKLTVITENLNTKVSATEVDNKVATAKQEAIDEAAAAAAAAIEARVGAIPADTTIKSYIDTAVGSGGTASAEAISTAKQEAIDTSKAYTDEKIAAATTVTMF